MNLLGFLKKSKDARSVFGKRELKIIEKQLLGVNLTQSEKNRLSRDIRKKFEFISEVSRFSDEFRLKKGAENMILVDEIVEELLESKYAKQIKKIYLFGSMVSNEMTFRSDVDIAVSFGNVNSKEATEFRIKMLGELPSRVDLQVFEMLPEKIRKDILRSGKILYSNEN